MKRFLLAAALLASPAHAAENTTVIVSNCKYSAVSLELRHCMKGLMSSVKAESSASERVMKLEMDLVDSLGFIDVLCADPDMPVPLRNRCTDWRNAREKP